MSNALLAALTELASQTLGLVHGPPAQQVAVASVAVLEARGRVVRHGERVALEGQVEEGARNVDVDADAS